MGTKKSQEVLSQLGVGLAAELERVFISLGYTTEDVKQLCRKGRLASLLWEGRGFGKAKIEVEIDRVSDVQDLIPQRCKPLTVTKHDSRSAALQRISLADIRLDHMLRQGEVKISMQTRVRRLKEVGLVPLDAYAYRIFWEGRERLPLWLRRKEETDWECPTIAFPGMEFGDETGYRGCLAMQWRQGEWQECMVNCDCELESRFLVIAVPG